MNRVIVPAGIFFALGGFLAALPACSPTTPPSIYNPTPEFVAGLEDQAHKLAEADLARFNAAEEQYKNEVSLEVDPANPNPFREGVGAYFKWYRNFTAYKIADIQRSESLLKPIVIQIEYTCDMMATNAWDEDAKDEFLGIDPRKNAEKETAFNVQRQVRFLREYPCDAHGSPLPTDDAVIPRGNFFVQGHEMSKYMPTAAN